MTSSTTTPSPCTTCAHGYADTTATDDGSAVEPRRSGPARRQVLRTAGLAGAGMVALAACGSGDSAEDAAQGAVDDASEAVSGAIDAASVPVGGGLVVQAAKVVITQPTEGDFKAFSAVCTHQQCLVSRIEDNVITCTCHGSEFDATTGAVKGGPASEPLAEKQVTVGADGITVT